MTVDLTSPRHVHLVGIGGAGMSGIARVLLQRGHTVSGTDLQEGRTLDELSAMGAVVSVGHDAEAVDGAEVVVVSAAVPDHNPEVEEAHRRGLPVYQRAEMLAALMSEATRVLVAGTHGKTTTTSMVVVGLQAAGLDPSYAVGGQLNETGSNAHAGSDDLFVAEADESDRSFLVFEPDLAIVTNVELDHPDEFEDDDQVQEAFTDFLGRRSPGGVAVICIDDPGARALVSEIDEPIVTYGEDPSADVRLVVDDGGGAVVRRDGEWEVRLELPAPGRHNLLNATAALTAAAWAGVDPGEAAQGLGSFAGPQRRFQRLGSAGGVEVVDDYAHHPTELRSTLAAARSVTDGRVVLVVQPHRYSRTQALGEELGRAAAAADVVVVTEVYASSEDPIPGVTGRSVAEAAETAGARVIWEPHLAALPERLAEVVQHGDLVLVTGAGDVTQVGPGLLDLLGDADD
ncbi:MAG: UDP-N-acetylmuramate--L-alanine ligase [Nitriliruptorales bacterium]|nr:UDP-N-acetylmuramate--L-alanine ligase [Nitriliruptorales bacterium]